MFSTCYNTSITSNFYRTFHIYYFVISSLFFFLFSNAFTIIAFIFTVVFLLLSSFSFSKLFNKSLAHRIKNLAIAALHNSIKMKTQ